MVDGGCVAAVAPGRPHAEWAPPSLHRAHTIPGSSVVYEFVVAEEMPALNLTPTIKSKLLSPQSVRVVNRVMYRFCYLVTTMFSVGVVLVFVVIVNPREIVRWIAPLVALLETPAVLMMAASVRVEMALPISMSYDFWFFTTTNTLMMISRGIAMRDVRVAVLPLAWLLNTHYLMTDAQL